MYILEIEIDTATDSIIIAGTKTPLNTVSIASRDKEGSIYSKLSRQNASTILLLNKGKRL